MIGPELIAERRERIRELAPGRIVPTAQLFVHLQAKPLHQFVDTLNQVGRLPPGLRAEISHLVVRAVARALDKHPHFNDFLLPQGGVHHNPKPHVGLSIHSQGREGLAIIEDPSGRTLDEVVVDAAAQTVEEGIGIQQRTGRAVRQHKHHPGMDWVMNRLVSESFQWLQDRAPRFDAWVRANIRHTGTFRVNNLTPLGVTAAAGNLSQAAVANLVICGPRLLPGCGEDARGPREHFTLGASFDVRLFEPYEAAGFLRDVVDLLADPEARLA